MKKIRLVLGALTGVSGIYMIYANWSVRGYHLLTMDSGAGHRVAVTYRWSVVVFLILLAADILLAFFAKKKREKRLRCPSCGAIRAERDKFCKKCGHAFTAKKTGRS